MKTKIIKIENCRNRKGCIKTSWEEMRGKTFERTEIKKAA